MLTPSAAVAVTPGNGGKNTIITFSSIQLCPIAAKACIVLLEAGLLSQHKTEKTAISSKID